MTRQGTRPQQTLLGALLVSAVAVSAFGSAGCVDCNDDGEFDSIGDLCPNPEPGKAVRPDLIGGRAFLTPDWAG